MPVVASRLAFSDHSLRVGRRAKPREMVFDRMEILPLTSAVGLRSTTTTSSLFGGFGVFPDDDRTWIRIGATTGGD